MREALVFGGSGQIGRPLVARLLGDGWQVTAVSRSAQAGMAGVRWVQGDFFQSGDVPSRADAIFSCGPLDLFAHWYAATGVEAPCIVAFGSTTAHVKQESPDPAERDVATRLREGERVVLATSIARGARAAVLRPTLVYGSGRDRTLTRIAAIARRWGRFALPRRACGLRQPVHVDDLAAAAVDACVHQAQGAFDLPGGETLAYRDMVARMLAALEPPARLHELPAPLFATVLALARRRGMGGFGEAALARLREDLVFDAAPARAAFGYAPRGFRPTAAMFTPD